VLVVDRRVRRGHSLVIKASMGTSLTLPVIDIEREAALAWLRANGFTIVAADPAAPTGYRDADYRAPAAVVVGNERDGLHPLWREHAGTVVSIPMLGAADSLNVTHAAALLLYEAVHQQRAVP
jgi:TrmH family RNA methyltransferase